jgi:hypothetical protein
VSRWVVTVVCAIHTADCRHSGTDMTLGCKLTVTQLVSLLE